VEKIHRYCKSKNLDTIKEFIIIESSMRGERKKFHEMLAFVKKYHGKIIIVADRVGHMRRNFNEQPILEAMRK
jgi:DNA invertase Pin-like site-specific DNA recombinase